MTKYNPSKIEKRWQKYWADKKIFIAEDFSRKPKKYVLIEFPYPSGEGLHMGHLRPYVAGDVYSRYLRMRGHEVMYPIGWDAFGLPAENYAIKYGVHPSESVAKNIKNSKKQIQSWGLSFDWSREINTTDPEYYKWTQWIFLQFYKAGLAYESTGLINWCPKDKTGLANEEVIDGRCERCGTKVEKKELRQWYLKITAYAEKLLDGLKKLDWPEQIKLQQENWIGRSEGAFLKFPILNSKFQLKVFTTRPDTLFGATYMVVAPEHEIISTLKSSISNFAEVKKYIEEAKNKTEIQRTAADKEKTGVELKGIKAINPATKEEIPIFAADYVLSGYGTGAIMAVPAHDERDWQFAKKYNLKIAEVIKSPNGEKLYTGNGPLVNSGKFSGVESEKAITLMAKEFGESTVQYKLRDWVFSRQRYWGEPIPIVHCEKCGIVPVPEKDLPVVLPKVKKYEPTGTGESPLAVIEEWVNTKCPKCGGHAKRETNTMPQWAGSSWYWLRYSDPKNKKELASKEKLAYWQPVDVYFGGMEHTTLHLLYSRFWNLFLFDQGLVTEREPYLMRVPHGIVLAADGEKMSKSRGNVVNPDEIVQKYGADTLRMYELFLGPHEMTVSWNERGIVGVYRFLNRIWEMKEGSKKERDILEIQTIKEDKDEILKKKSLKRFLHKTIKKVTEDIENFRFNTAISALMIQLNEMEKWGLFVPRDIFENFIILLAPFAPHITEEIWQNVLGHKKSIHLEKWLDYDKKLIAEELVSIVVQVDGRARSVISLPTDSGEEEVKKLALADEKIKKHLTGREIRKTIFVKNRLINFVV
jgi:leucyl-tRNA synthetase